MSEQKKVSVDDFIVDPEYFRLKPGSVIPASLRDYQNAFALKAEEGQTEMARVQEALSRVLQHHTDLYERLSERLSPLLAPKTYTEAPVPKTDGPPLYSAALPSALYDIATRLELVAWNLERLLDALEV